MGQSRPQEKKYTDPVETSAEKLDIVAGKNPVYEALKSGAPLDAIYVSHETGGLSDIIALAKERDIPVKVVNDQKLSRLCGGVVHQGVVAEGACAQYVSLETLLARGRAQEEPPFYILCDEIEDPHNLGAIIRTAEAAGVTGLILPKRHSASLNATVGKTSAGAISWLPVARVSNLVSAMEELQQNGVWVYGTDAEGAPYQTVDFTGATALVIGSEGFGMRRLVRDRCDAVVALPMRGHVNSLNASVAAGILIYEVVRQRIGAGAAQAGSPEG